MAEFTRSDTVFHTYRLNNGLQIVGQYMPDFESVTLSYYVRAGSRDELDPSIAGIARLLQLLLFKSNKTWGWQRLAPEFNHIGAELNAFTSHEGTMYYGRVLGEYLDQAFKLLSDMMYPRLVESDFEAEKEVVFKEMSRAYAEPYNRAYRTTMQVYFGDHPLGHDILGTSETIRNIKVEQMRGFWKKHYVANNIIIAVAGNFDWEHFTHLVIQRCSNWRTGDIRRNIEYYEPSQSINRVVVDKKLKRQIVIIAMPTVDIKDPDYYAAVLGGSILGDSYCSRLHRNICQKGLAESASASVWAMEGAGIMLMDAIPTPEDAPRVIKLLRAELDGLLKDGIHEDELRCAKDRWISDMAFSSESTFSRMRSLATDWAIEGRLISIDEEIERIEKVTIEGVMHALHRFPMHEKQVLNTLGPLSEEKLLV